MNEDPRLYELAKSITFESGFETWTDPRTGEVHHNPNKKKKTMNARQQQAIQTAIANAEDNLARAKLQKKCDPNWISGNGESIDQYIQMYEKELSELKAE